MCTVSCQSLTRVAAEKYTCTWNTDVEHTRVVHLYVGHRCVPSCYTEVLSYTELRTHSRGTVPSYFVLRTSYFVYYMYVVYTLPGSTQRWYRYSTCSTCIQVGRYTGTTRIVVLTYMYVPAMYRYL